MKKDILNLGCLCLIGLGVLIGAGVAGEGGAICIGIVLFVWALSSRYLR